MDYPEKEVKLPTPTPWPPHSILEAVKHPGLEVVTSPEMEAVSPESRLPVYPDSAGSWRETPKMAVPWREEKQRILGLSVRAFWAVVIAAIVIISVAIGAGVGGGMAAARRTAAVAVPDTSSSNNSSNPAASTSVPSTTNGILPAPTDGGCPRINGTAFKATDASGNPVAWVLPGQQFTQLCETNYPSGSDLGNPGIHDILKIWLPSLEDCMTACAYHNAKQFENMQNGIDVGQGGFCKSVTIVKSAGEYCYLKNGTGVNNTRGNPSIYSSAVLAV